MEPLFLALLFLSFGLGFALAYFLFFQKSQSNEEFHNIAMQALNQNSNAFLKLAESTMARFHEKAQFDLEKKEESIANLVKPVKESLEKFDGKIKDLENVRIGAYAALKEQVVAMSQTQKELRFETGNLVKALRKPHVRGRWGEIQLKRVVEISGMLEHCDFMEQKSLEGDERKLRPDLLVHLPGGRTIILDAKAPLESYLEALEVQDEALSIVKMKEHAKQIRNHMAALSRKSYWEYLSATPDFVVLFLPSEAFFSAALEQDPTLIEVGVEQKVILSTPTTLIALLKSIAFGWRQEALSKNAEEISQLGGELYKRISDLSLHWQKLGKHLEQTVQAYNQAVGTLESRVLVSARRFRDLESSRADKEIEVLDAVTTLPRPIHAPEINEGKTEKEISFDNKQSSD